MNNSEIKFNIIYPIGIRCTTEILLSKLNLKKMSSIFGSLNIKNFDNIVSCIRTNFDILCNEKNIISSENIKSIKNALYIRTMNNKFDNINNWHDATIAHHNLFLEKDKNHIERCIKRFNIIRDNNIPTLFINISSYPEYNNTLDNKKILNILNETNWKNFHILFIYFNGKNDKSINNIINNEFMSIYIVNDTCNTSEKEYLKGAKYLEKILKNYNIENLLSIDYINNIITKE